MYVLPNELLLSIIYNLSLCEFERAYFALFMTTPSHSEYIKYLTYHPEMIKSDGQPHNIHKEVHKSEANGMYCTLKKKHLYKKWGDYFYDFVFNMPLDFIYYSLNTSEYDYRREFLCGSVYSQKQNALKGNDKGWAVVSFDRNGAHTQGGTYYCYIRENKSLSPKRFFCPQYHIRPDLQLMMKAGFLMGCIHTIYLQDMTSTPTVRRRCQKCANPIKYYVVTRLYSKRKPTSNQFGDYLWKDDFFAIPINIRKYNTYGQLTFNPQHLGCPFAKVYAHRLVDEFKDMYEHVCEGGSR